MWKFSKLTAFYGTNTVKSFISSLNLVKIHFLCVQVISSETYSFDESVNKENTVPNSQTMRSGGANESTIAIGSEKMKNIFNMVEKACIDGTVSEMSQHHSIDLIEFITVESHCCYCPKQTNFFPRPFFFSSTLSPEQLNSVPATDYIQLYRHEVKMLQKKIDLLSNEVSCKM